MNDECVGTNILDESALGSPELRQQNYIHLCLHTFYGYAALSYDRFRRKSAIERIIELACPLIRKNTKSPK